MDRLNVRYRQEFRMHDLWSCSMGYSLTIHFFTHASDTCAKRAIAPMSSILSSLCVASSPFSNSLSFRFCIKYFKGLKIEHSIWCCAWGVQPNDVVEFGVRFERMWNRIHTRNVGTYSVWPWFCNAPFGSQYPGLVLSAEEGAQKKINTFHIDRTLDVKLPLLFSMLLVVSHKLLKVVSFGNTFYDIS